MSENTTRPTSQLIGKIAGMEVCRRAIYQTVIGREGWANDMLKAMAACKMLGVKTFELDVRYDPDAPRPNGQQQKKQHGQSMFISLSEMFRETEDWKGTQRDDDTPESKCKTGADVLILYAVVVE